MQQFMQIMQLEQRHAPELEQLAIKVVGEIWGVPEKMLKPKLTDNVDVEGDPDIDLGEDEQEQAEIDAPMRKQINKRISMNMLTQGSAVHNMMTMHHIVNKELNQIEPRLLELYTQWSSGSVALYWMFDVMAVAKQLAGQAIGSCRVQYPNDEEEEQPQQPQPQIIAKAFCFPVLCQELSKGVMEVISHHGFKDMDEKTVSTITKHADRMEDEPWLIQVGPELWRRFLKVAPRKAALAQVVAVLATKEPDEVHDILMAVVENPDKAKQMLEDLVAAPEEFDLPNELTDTEDWSE
jgi:hypothetical protein